MGEWKRKVRLNRECTQSHGYYTSWEVWLDREHRVAADLDALRLEVLTCRHTYHLTLGAVVQVDLYTHVTSVYVYLSERCLQQPMCHSSHSEVCQSSVGALMAG